jgi:hypothetical protein
VTQTALTLSEAAAACGVSRSTVKRKLAEFGNAYRDGDGVWRVPIADLLGAGLKLRPRPGQTVDQGHDPGVNGADQGQIQQLAAELAAERMARQVAETKVMLLTANLEDLRYSLRAISGPPRVQEAPPVAEAPPQPAPVQAPLPVVEQPPPRRSWWARIRAV